MAAGFKPMILRFQQSERFCTDRLFSESESLKSKIFNLNIYYSQKLEVQLEILQILQLIFSYRISENLFYTVLHC